MARDVEKEYLLKIKEDFDSQYKDEMNQKEKAIKQLQEMVIKQNEVIQDMKNKLTTPEMIKKKVTDSEKQTKAPKVEKERPKEIPKGRIREHSKDQVSSKKIISSKKMTIESRPSQRATDVAKKIIKKTTEVEDLSEYEELIEEDAEEEDMNSEEEKDEILKGKFFHFYS